jgi:hypothetical protein
MLLSIGSLFGSCNSSNEVSTLLATADSVEVRFANTQNDQLSHNTAMPEAVQKLVLLTSKEANTGALECSAPPAGIILFFEKGKMLQAVMFSDLKAKCRYFITKVNDKTYHTPISDEAVTFLQGLQ